MIDLSYEDLLIEADAAGIIVKEAPLCSADGRCKGHKIAIRRDIPTLAKKADVLAEELGHYYTSVGVILEQDTVVNRKQERIARLWSYNKRISMSGLIAAWNHGCRNLYEIADYLEVAEDTLADALECYRQKYGTSIWIDNYRIQFEPYFTIGKVIMFNN